jgi:hypothetical protein
VEENERGESLEKNDEFLIKFVPISNAGKEGGAATGGKNQHNFDALKT